MSRRSTRWRGVTEVHSRSPERRAHTGDVTIEGMRSQPRDDDPRFALLVARITERLRPVCAGWDEAEFEELVLQIALKKAQWGELDRIVAHRDD